MKRILLAAGTAVLGAVVATAAFGQGKPAAPSSNVPARAPPPFMAKPGALPQAPPKVAAPLPTAADWRTPDPQNVLVVDTNKGRIYAELLPDVAPAHVARIKELTRRGFYDGLQFFRVVDKFMDQTGDPQNTGTGGSDLPNLQAEISFRRTPGEANFVQVAAPTGGEIGFVGPLTVMSQVSAMAALTADGKVSTWGLFCPGVLGMARAQTMDSANSQFFFMRAAYPSLDKNYTAFGRVLSGMTAVNAIKVGEPVPDPKDVMTKVQILADMSPAPSIRVVDTKSAWFKAAVERARTSRGADFSACDIDIPVEVK